MKAINAAAIVTTVVSLLAIACGGEDPDFLAGRGGSGGNENGEGPGGETGGDPGDPAQCKSREYKGFDAKSLTATRPVERLGVDRNRLKPFSALQTEYMRVIGNTPASLAGAGPTFGAAAARWYEEPEANAVALQTAYGIGFDACLTYTATDAGFAAAPTAANATEKCGAMARKFWSKTPAPAEIQACADVATKGAATEPDTRRKWAYACASVLTSAGFLSY